MGLRGPRPTPSVIKQARGTYRPDRAPANEARAIGKPRCPKWLNKDAAVEFRRLVRLLGQMGLLGSAPLITTVAGLLAICAAIRQAETAARSYSLGWHGKDQVAELGGLHAHRVGPRRGVDDDQPNTLRLSLLDQ